MSQTYEYGDYNRGGMLAFLFAMVVTLLFFVYVAFLHSGVDLQEIKTKDVEQKMETPEKAEVAEEADGGMSEETSEKDSEKAADKSSDESEKSEE